MKDEEKSKLIMYDTKLVYMYYSYLMIFHVLIPSLRKLLDDS